KINLTVNHMLSYGQFLLRSSLRWLYRLDSYYSPIGIIMFNKKCLDWKIVKALFDLLLMFYIHLTRLKSIL
ncbi:MAG TPA: hypothetical protein PKW37_07835, partial [Salinivirgaceae bacterium]|nr:hypothetical protein [Salinivirgaceae bacterium]